MEFLRLLLLFLHLVGLASLIGGFVVQLAGPERRIVPAILYGALIQLITGPLLIAVAAVLDKTVNDPKMDVKLLVLLVITVSAFAFRKRPVLGAGVFFGLFTLSLLNVGVAVFWT